MPEQLKPGDWVSYYTWDFRDQWRRPITREPSTVPGRRFYGQVLDKEASKGKVWVQFREGGMHDRLCYIQRLKKVHDLLLLAMEAPSEQ